MEGGGVGAGPLACERICAERCCAITVTPLAVIINANAPAIDLLPTDKLPHDIGQDATMSESDQFFRRIDATGGNELV